MQLDHSCYGRDHAHQRIDLYPVEGSAFAPQSLFTYAGARKARAATKLLLGYREPSIFPVASPPCRFSGKLSNIDSSVLGLKRCAFRYNTLFDEPPQRDR